VVPAVAVSVALALLVVALELPVPGVAAFLLRRAAKRECRKS
jgi:hypothetical protein